MEFKLFSDIIDSLEKLYKGILGLKDLPPKEREHYREIIDDSCLSLDFALVMVINRLGGILRISDSDKFAIELLALENYEEWLRLERDLRLCSNLRVAGAELENLWTRVASEIAFRDAGKFMGLIHVLFYDEARLADYITKALTHLSQLGRKVLTSPGSFSNAQVTVRGVRNCLLKERQHLITIQIELLDKVI